MPVCGRCKAECWEITMGDHGVCLECHAEMAHEDSDDGTDQPAADEWPGQLKPSRSENAAARVLLTTESAPNLDIAKRIDIVTAEVVIGMHLFRDIAAAFRDTFGGRSATMQKGLRDARKTALDELRREAHAIGADAVVAVDLDYSEITGGGKSMLFLVASGTAVILKGSS